VALCGLWRVLFGSLSRGRLRLTSPRSGRSNSNATTTPPPPPPPKDAGADAAPSSDDAEHLHIAALGPTFGDHKPKDGSQGSTLGDGTPTHETDSTSVTTPCR